MRIREKLKSEVRNAWLYVRSIFNDRQPVIQNTVPYVSQFAHPEYAEKILKDGVAKTSDPNWKETGAGSADEYAEWVLTMCGMACASMVLKHFNKTNDGIVSLAKDAKQYGVYKQHGTEISNMHYKEFADWINERYGLTATVYTRLSVSGLQQLLSEGSLIIVSVNPNIRQYDTANTSQRGGHLVLVTGYDMVSNTITLHNPSGFVSENTQENHVVQMSRFLKYYAGRGIAVSAI